MMRQRKKEDIQLLLIHRNRSRAKKNIKLKQKPLTNFLKTTDKIDKENEKKKKKDEYLKKQYLFVSPLMNQRHLFEIMELSGIRNNGSNKRLSQLYSRNVSNINSDSLYRMSLHSIINNQHLYRLPIGHSFDSFNTSYNAKFDYISSVKFDKMGSLFCSGSTNGEIGIFDFDKCLSKWNSTIRIIINGIINLQKENKYKLENGDDNIIDIKQGCDYSKVTMNNVILTKINTHFKIENIEWSDNMNDIAVCGHGGGLLYIYDLRRLNNKPKYRLITGSKGHHPLLINKYSTKYSSINAMNLIVGGDRMGNTYCWDLKNKTNKPCLRFDAVSKQTSLTSSFKQHNYGKNINVSHFAVKQLHISSDGILLYVVRENGFIELMDIRKPGFIYKSIDLWRCPLKDANDDNHDHDHDHNHNNKFYDNSVYSKTATCHRARIDDAIILESMNCALLKLQNNSLVNVHLESNTIRKTYSFQQEESQNENVEFLSRVNQRRMCSFEQYSLPEMLITGTFKPEMVAIDISTELDAYYFEKEYKQKRIKLGLMNDDALKYQSNCYSFQSAKSEYIKNEQYKKTKSIHSCSYGLMGKTQLSSIMTSCSLHPKSLYIVCGTLNNCLEIVGCASNPF